MINIRHKNLPLCVFYSDILKLLNPKLQGASHGVLNISIGQSVREIKKTMKRNAHMIQLNLAVYGSMAK